jgi:hypothetical protein
MPGEMEQSDREGFPQGARPIAAARLGRLRIPPIPVRTGQAADEPPTFTRARFGWSVGEISGSLGDLGTFLPHIVGAITIVRNRRDFAAGRGAGEGQLSTQCSH